MGWRERVEGLIGRRPAVQPCKATTGDICVVVERSDGLVTGLSGFKVTLTGPTRGNTNTDAGGIAEFAACKPGAYKYTVSLPAGDEKKWRLASSGGTVQLGRGGVAAESVVAEPIGTLLVRVYDDLQPRNRIRAKIVSGADTSEHSTGDLHMTVVAGKVNVSADALEAQAHAAGGGQAQVDVPQGGTGVAQIVLPVVNVVTPQLVPASDEAWFLRPDPPAQPAPPHPVTPPAPWPALADEPPITLRASLHETKPAKSYTGNGVLTFDASRLALYRDAACTGPALVSGAALTNAELKSGLTLYSKGRERGAASVQLGLAPSGNPHITVQADAVKSLTLREVNVVEPKIDVEYQVVLWDRGLHAHQKDKNGLVEKTLLRADATRVELSVAQRGGDAPYTLSGRVEAPNCEVFLDEKCTRKLDPTQPIPVTVMSSKPYVLWLRGTTRGQFDLKLTLSAASSSHIRVRGPAVQKMGVVELQAQLYQHDESALANETFEANKDTLDQYFTALKDKVIPDQKLMTDAQKVAPGRLLHAQDAGSHGRAKLVLKARDASQWPAGTEDYTVHLTTTDTTGSVAVCDAETEGKVVDFTAPDAGIKASDLGAEKTWWIEGSTACKAWRDVVLDVSLDRAVGGLAKEPKRRADWARFTVVKVKEIELDYQAEPNKPVAWNEPEKRFYINLKTGDDGRKIKLAVALTEKLEEVPIHFMLATHANNGKTAHWNVDLPATWKWGSLTKDIKTSDRSEPDKLLHRSKKTNADGKADLELLLSRLGGDVFEPAAYITQDPHLAKYVQAHVDLAKRKPVRASHTVTVWREFWYREVKVPGINNPALAGAVGQYERVRARMEAAPTLDVAKASISGGPAIYPRYMVSPGGGTGDALVVSDLNRDSFFAGYAASSERPLEMPILIGDAMLRHMLRSGGPAQSAATNLTDRARSSFPLSLAVSCPGLGSFYVVKPCVNPGNLVVAGTWKIYQKESDGTKSLERTGNWVDADVTLAESRATVSGITLGFPSNAPGGVAWDPAKTFVDIVGLVIRGARSILGISTTVGGVKVNVAVYDPADADDFQNTIVHELAHAFGQVPKGDPANGVAGIPSHPIQADEGFGNHCREDTNKCVMYDSGPIVGSYNKFCDKCHPYLLAQDFTRMT